MLMISILDISLKISNSRLQPNVPWVNELNLDIIVDVYICSAQSKDVTRDSTRNVNYGNMLLYTTWPSPEMLLIRGRLRKPLWCWIYFSKHKNISMG